MVSVFIRKMEFSPAALAIFAILRKFHACDRSFKRSSSLQMQCASRKDLYADDVISLLPDDILILIISHMPIESAIRTSILSRRWRNLHKSLYRITLDCDLLLGRNYIYHTHCKTKLIVDSLDKFLRFRSGSKIRYLNLSCCVEKSDTERFEQCIYSIGRSGIEKLDLTFRYSGLPFSSHLISEMPSLRQLGLSVCTLQPSLKSHCNSLKILWLSYVILPPGAIECVLTNCLRLQTLSICHCKSPVKLSFSGPLLQLKALLIDVCEGVEEIEIYASNLVVFELMNTRKVNLKLNHAPQLQSVYLCIPRKDIVPFLGWKFSQDFPHLKSLNFGIRGDIFQVSSKPMEINIFGNLRRLDISLYSSRRIDLLLLTPLLQVCPLLQEFHLHTFLPEHDVPQGNALAIVFHSELKKMEISGFIGTENDIQFALYILKCATSLEQMLVTRQSKTYRGCGWWCPQHESPLIEERHRMIHRHLQESPWTGERHRMIQKQLQGQAISKAAQVIIRQKALIEYNWPCDCSVSIAL